MSKVSLKRILWIDLIKGLLIIGVIIYHFGYDLSEIYGVDINFYNPIFESFRIIGAIIFILLCGVNSNFSHNNFKRGLNLLSIAMAITIVTFFYDSSYYIKFGIVHLLGVTTILYHFYRRASYQFLFILLGLSITITLIVKQISVNVSFLFPLGLYNSTFTSSDYYPIFGFIIFFIMGNIIGKYIKNINWLYNWQKNNVLTIIGKHSLIIYLIHQPIILMVLTLFSTLY